MKRKFLMIPKPKCMYLPSTQNHSERILKLYRDTQRVRTFYNVINLDPHCQKIFSTQKVVPLTLLFYASDV